MFHSSLRLILSMLFINTCLLLLMLLHVLFDDHYIQAYLRNEHDKNDQYGSLFCEYPLFKICNTQE